MAGTPLGSHGGEHLAQPSGLFPTVRGALADQYEGAWYCCWVGSCWSPIVFLTQQSEALEAVLRESPCHAPRQRLLAQTPAEPACCCGNSIISVTASRSRPPGCLRRPCWAGTGAQPGPLPTAGLLGDACARRGCSTESGWLTDSRPGPGGPAHLPSPQPRLRLHRLQAHQPYRRIEKRMQVVGTDGYLRLPGRPRGRPRGVHPAVQHHPDQRDRLLPGPPGLGVPGARDPSPACRRRKPASRSGSGAPAALPARRRTRWPW